MAPRNSYVCHCLCQLLTVAVFADYTQTKCIRVNHCAENCTYLPTIDNRNRLRLLLIFYKTPKVNKNENTRISGAIEDFVETRLPKLYTLIGFATCLILLGTWYIFFLGGGTNATTAAPVRRD